MSKKIMPRYTIEIADEIESRITDIANANNLTMAEVLRKAFALPSLAERHKEKGFLLGILECDNKND